MEYKGKGCGRTAYHHNPPPAERRAGENRQYREAHRSGKQASDAFKQVNAGKHDESRYIHSNWQ
jgi:hypothetical protein